MKRNFTCDRSFHGADSMTGFKTLSDRSILLSLLPIATAISQPAHPIAIAVHGGAGTISRKTVSPETETAIREKLTEALRAGYRILEHGGTSLDAVENTVRILEDSPLFNAGKGAVFTNAGTHELDAAIMDGSTLKAGAVAAVRHIKNPVTLARLVMEKSGHVMMVGDGAETFGKLHGIDTADQSYFYTERRWKELQIRRAVEQKDSVKKSSSGHIINREMPPSMGTVGAVAVDKSGNLAAANSTGGTTNKRYGRVGDTPIIGAGTYANNRTCAVAATGTGEYFIRTVAAYSVHALIEHARMSLQQAASTVVMEQIGALGGDGGLIAMDVDGNIAMVFNTEGMYRGSIDTSGQIRIQLYKE